MERLKIHMWKTQSDSATSDSRQELSSYRYSHYIVAAQSFILELRIDLFHDITLCV